MVYELIGDQLMHNVIPINSMRNQALLNAKTSLVAMVDVDLMISRSLYEDLLNPDR